LKAVAAEGLLFTTDRDPGIKRIRRGRGFLYFQPDGKRVGDGTLLTRIRSLAIPPAYRNVWICVSPRGHLQATGKDARGRKQYRYHARWRSHRDAQKFDHILEFGHALPRIRRRVAQDLRKAGLPRERVLATIVKLLDATLVRVGNEEYARANRSFGLTTLRNRHVSVTGDTLHFEFRGKSGIFHRVSVSDPALARIVRRCALRKLPVGNSREVNRELKKVIAAVAARLGNTPAICRKCYIHPEVLLAYSAGRLVKVVGMTTARALNFLLRKRGRKT
jgi:DNA topoisomerase-1